MTDLPPPLAQLGLAGLVIVGLAWIARELWRELRAETAGRLADKDKHAERLASAVETLREFRQSGEAGNGHR